MLPLFTHSRHIALPPVFVYCFGAIFGKNTAIAYMLTGGTECEQVVALDKNKMLFFNLFFGYIGLKNNERANTILAVREAKNCAYDKKRLRADEKLMINCDYTVSFGSEMSSLLIESQKNSTDDENINIYDIPQTVIQKLLLGEDADVQFVDMSADLLTTEEEQMQWIAEREKELNKEIKTLQRSNQRSVERTETNPIRQVRQS